MTRILDVRQKILKQNDETARAMRARFHDAGTFVCDLVSSPGAGKTELLTYTMRELRERGMTCAAVVGDLATNNDAERLATSGAPAKQILTGTMCHLEADMVAESIRGWDLSTLDALFIENVGNLVCPATWDLGADKRILLFPVTEGEDKPLKYPTLINTADLVIINKLDLAEAVGFDRELAIHNVERVRPDVPVLELSVRNNAGLEAWMNWVVHHVAADVPVAPAEASSF